MTGKKLLSAMLAGMKALSMLCRLIHHRVQRLCGSRVQSVVSRTMYITTLIMISCSLRSLTKYLVDSPPQYITNLQVVNPFRIRKFSVIIVKKKYTEKCKCAVLYFTNIGQYSFNVFKQIRQPLKMLDITFTDMQCQFRTTYEKLNHFYKSY